MATKKRHTIRKLTDLLPEILIEAQGCDEITAEAALRRAYEGLCMEYGFGEQTMWLTIHESDRDEEGDVRISLDNQNLLQVMSVCRKSRFDFEPVAFLYDGRELVIPRGALPFTIDKNGHGVGLRVTATFMPDVDEELRDAARVTKWRQLVVAKTLEDLFSMEGQRWTSAARYQVYASKADKMLETYLITERYYGNVAQSRSAASSPMFNVFC